MKDYIVERVFDIAHHVLEKGCTIREAAKVFCVSKSTAHKDLNERLPLLDFELFEKVSAILKENWNERYLRGGFATQKKFAKLKGKSGDVQAASR